MQFRQIVRGRDGWTFILKNKGQTITPSDYEEISHDPYVPKTGSVRAEKIFDEALLALHSGKYIEGRVFAMLYRKYGKRFQRFVHAQAIYLPEFELSLTTLRMRTHTPWMRRRMFNGMFSTIEHLISCTVDITQRPPIRG